MVTIAQLVGDKQPQLGATLRDLIGTATWNASVKAMCDALISATCTAPFQDLNVRLAEQSADTFRSLLTMSTSAWVDRPWIEKMEPSYIVPRVYCCPHEHWYPGLDDDDDQPTVLPDAGARSPIRSLDSEDAKDILRQVLELSDPKREGGRLSAREIGTTLGPEIGDAAIPEGTVRYWRVKARQWQLDGRL